VNPTPQQKGRQWEDEWTGQTEGSQQINSGAVWFSKMDVSDRAFLWSCKYTDKKSFSIKASDIDEVVYAVEGPGGVGIDTMPGMAIRIADACDLVVLRKEDFLRLIQTEVKYVEPSKQDAKRAKSKIPQLLRGDETCD
jgi:hypothetical protein